MAASAAGELALGTVTTSVEWVVVGGSFCLAKTEVPPFRARCTGCGAFLVVEVAAGAGLALEEPGKFVE